MKKTGIELIAEERQEQLVKHGWTLERDQTYTEGELLDAALQYIEGPNARLGDGMLKYWPISWDRKWYKTGNRIEELKRAAALIAAEIDRLQSQQS